ncbi:MAG: 23S rRNA (pseudouridine(1915)-N(3))-methyltransferase RlmH [Solirubrobacterales bacterium]|nr:23S rRNA (pseudouridine(1915)-N(3))-methyltransferase RlmH [Solirubrobacterales bacterium]
MKITLMAVGRIRAPFAEGQSHYLKMLRGPQPVEVVEVKDDRTLVKRIDPECHLVALEAGGEAMSSERWASWLDRRRRAGRRVVVVVGGPAGLPAEAVGAARERLSLGPQTMAHQLARVVLLEQIYRAAKILAGEKYHL